jgi:hypothetical protein
MQANDGVHSSTLKGFPVLQATVEQGKKTQQLTELLFCRLKKKIKKKGSNLTVSSGWPCSSQFSSAFSSVRLEYKKKCQLQKLPLICIFSPAQV